jgi:integrase
MNIKQARQKAMKKLYEIDEGNDPQLEKKRVTADTMADLVNEFVDKHCKHRRKTWETDKSRLERHVLSRWSGRKPETLTRHELSELHRDIGEGAKIEANRVIETIRTMFNFAQTEGVVDDGFNPASKVNKYEEKSRDRWLREYEMRSLSDALNEIDNIYMHHYYWLLALTATRRNEMLEAKWEHIDLHAREIFLPDTKNGSDHTVPLSSLACDLLEELPREEGNPWVFCSHIAGQRIKEVNQRWRRVRKDAGLEGVQLHDLRRTAASWLAQGNYSPFVVKKLLNHSVKGPTGIYARMDTGSVREAVEWYGEAIIEAVDGKNSILFDQ